MDTELWIKIADFNLDAPPAEYGFLTRLADENCWTRNFTEKAVAEYKKFIYLAATTNQMVSPSGIIDAVWHQHLVFTKSYAALCKIAGKDIQHIPGTEGANDYEKFKQAKARTKQLYNEVFGEQPADIWDYESMLEQLALPKAKYKLRTLVNIGILAFLALGIPFYHLLLPVYININNPGFLYTYIALFICALAALEIYNRVYLRRVLAGFAPFTFIHDLTAFELVFLKTGKLQHVIHCVINEFINQGHIAIKWGKILEMGEPYTPRTAEDYAIIDAVNGLEPVNYPTLLGQLVQKPIFANIANCMNAFKKYFSKSKALVKLFCLNFVVLLFVMLLGFERLLTGISRDRPVNFIAWVLLFAAVATAAFLWRTVWLLFSDIIPAFYKSTVLPARSNANTWEWQYFLGGLAVLSTTFMPLVNIVENRGGSSGSSCGSDGSGGSGGCGGGSSGCGGCGGGGH